MAVKTSKLVLPLMASPAICRKCSPGGTGGAVVQGEKYVGAGNEVFAGGASWVITWTERRHLARILRQPDPHAFRRHPRNRPARRRVQRHQEFRHLCTACCRKASNCCRKTYSRVPRSYCRRKCSTRSSGGQTKEPPLQPRRTAAGIEHAERPVRAVAEQTRRIRPQAGELAIRQAQAA